MQSKTNLLLAEIIKIRKQRNLTVTECAKRCGINRAMWYRVESGNREVVKIDMLERMAGALGKKIKITLID